MKNQLSHRRGFTLTEILVALAIFALGGTAIMALFITNVRLSRQAMDYTRAAEITRNVRSLMTQSMSRPINLSETDNIYAFYYPETTINLRTDDYRDQWETERATATATKPGPGDFGGSPVERTIFFRLPKQGFDAAAIDYFATNDRLTVLPRDSVTASGSNAVFDTGEPKVFSFLPDELRQAGAIDGLDADDRMFYQFDVSIRKSVQRSSVDNASGDGSKQPLDDLYVVHVRIYKGFDLTDDVLNDPFFEWDFYINAAQ